MQPYKDDSNIRTFSKNVDPMELVWHQDAEDKEIEVLEGKGWELQMDNELPFELVSGDHIFIKRHRVHRIHKGVTDLKIKING